MPQRYSPNPKAFRSCPKQAGMEIIQDNKGDWVTFDDYCDLQDDLNHANDCRDELEEEVRALIEELQDRDRRLVLLEEENEALKRQQE